ncbi:MAG: magnesium/cobalt transporter CorA [Segniliparus sp.]|uniref:magnesium/cobalt transporter CorA n=1 Tax=Segniliparus sp. TaxID=2804064 RepID=UPI003F2A729B
MPALPPKGASRLRGTPESQPSALATPLSVLGFSSAAQTAAAKKPAPRVAKPVVDCAVYVDGVRQPGRPSPAEAITQVREAQPQSCDERPLSRFVWVGLFEPDEEQMRAVGAVFGLHELMMEDAVHAHQRPKLEQYDDMFELVLKTVKYVAHESISQAKEIVESGEIILFVGRDFIVTVRHGGHGELAGVRKHLEEQSAKLAIGPLVVMHSIADHIVDGYMQVTEAVELDIDAMEESIFTPGAGTEIELIYLLKREVMEMKRAVNPLSLALSRLAHPDPTLTIAVPKEVRRYFRDVLDHHTVVAEQVSSFDEVLSSLVQAALGKISVQQNTDMRQITAWAAIFAVSTLVAGIYGMNFDNMPELHWHYGYFIALGVMAGISLSLFIGFRRSKWL